MQKEEGREWIERYLVCWRCYQLQEIYRAADPKYKESECRFLDILIGLYYRIYKRTGG